MPAEETYTRLQWTDLHILLTRSFNYLKRMAGEPISFSGGITFPPESHPNNSEGVFTCKTIYLLYGFIQQKGAPPMKITTWLTVGAPNDVRNPYYERKCALAAFAAGMLITFLIMRFL